MSKQSTHRYESDEEVVLALRKLYQVQPIDLQQLRTIRSTIVVSYLEKTLTIPEQKYNATLLEIQQMLEKAERPNARFTAQQSVTAELERNLVAAEHKLAEIQAALLSSRLREKELEEEIKTTAMKDAANQEKLAKALSHQAELHKQQAVVAAEIATLQGLH